MDASDGDIRENQHEEDRIRDIHVSKRDSEAASEDQPHKLKKTVRFEQKLEEQQFLLVRHKDRPGSVLVQKSGHVDDDVQISVLDASCEMDGRKSRYIGKVLEWYRGEDT